MFVATKKNLPPVMSEAIVVLARARPTAGGPPPPRPRSPEADRGKRCHLFRGFYALRTCHIQDVGSILAACSCSFLSAFIFCLERASHAMTKCSRWADSGEAEEPILRLLQKEERKAHEDVLGGQTHHPRLQK